MMKAKDFIALPVLLLLAVALVILAILSMPLACIAIVIAIATSCLEFLMDGLKAVAEQIVTWRHR